MVRLLLNALQENLKKSDSGAARILVACLECLFEWLERVMKFINRNAYILTAVHGYNFCKSAKEAFSLIMRNIVRVYVLDKVKPTLRIRKDLCTLSNRSGYRLFAGSQQIPAYHLRFRYWLRHDRIHFLLQVLFAGYFDSHYCRLHMDNSHRIL